MAEFAVVEFAAALGRSTESGRRYLSHAVEGRYRLPRCWARLEAGDLPAWRLAFIAERTMCLSPAGGGVRGRHRSRRFAHKIGPAQLGRLIEEAKARFDPDRPRPNGWPRPRPGTSTSRSPTSSVAGTVHVDGDLDLADALDLEAAIAADAHQQLLLGSTESLDVRRSIAAGNLARNQQHPRPPPTRPRPAAPGRPQASRWCCTSTSSTPPSSAPAGSPGSTRPPARSPPSRSASGAPNPDTQITVQPVLDLAEHLHVGSYEASARLKLQTQLRDGTCAFPFCFRPAEHCDCEHRVPHDPDRDDAGPTCTCNLAPCCRRHHRAKTTGGWTYVTVEPGVYLWRSPLGYQFLRDHTGTLDVTPDDERRRLARELPRPLRRPTIAGPADPEP